MFILRFEKSIYREKETEREQRERDGVTSRMGTKPGARSLFQTCHVDAGPKDLDCPGMLSQVMNREGDVKWSRWDLSEWPYAVFALQAGYHCTTP